MVQMTPARDALDLLARWPATTGTLSTKEAVALAGVGYKVAYGWLTALSVRGYVARCAVDFPCCPYRVVLWTLTRRGRAHAA